VDQSIFEFASELWIYPGEGPWFFLTLPNDVADEIDDAVGERAGFGSIPVEVTIGASTWKTSLFPDKKSASFVLPVKKPIRVREGLEEHSTVWVRLRVDPDRT
jgi:Domain of unknown function (DUF1905)